MPGVGRQWPQPDLAKILPVALNDSKVKALERAWDIEKGMEVSLRDDRIWHGSRILVAEDNLLLAEMICDFLHDFGLEAIGPFSRVADAAAAARQRALDGAVLDLKLGRELCLPICAILAARRIPFLFLTGYSDHSLIPSEFRAATIIAKPFENDEMKAALSQMLKLGEGRSTPRPQTLHD